MKFERKTYLILVMFFSLLTVLMAALYFLDRTSIDLVMVCLGATQLFSGLNQMSMSQQIDKKGLATGNKLIGGFSFILGIVLIVVFIIRTLF